MNHTQKALLIGTSSRILIVAVFVLCSFLFTVSSEQPASHIANPLPIVNLFNRDDSGYYISIALNGYATMLDWNFFPLYPAAMKALSLPFTPFLTNEMAIQNTIELAGFIISNVAFFVSVYFFYKLTNKIFNYTNSPGCFGVLLVLGWSSILLCNLQRIVIHGFNIRCFLLSRRRQTANCSATWILGILH